MGNSYSKGIEYIENIDDALMKHIATRHTISGPFKLTPETDPRCIEYWIKVYPEASKSRLEKKRMSWINTFLKKR